MLKGVKGDTYVGSYAVNIYRKDFPLLQFHKDVAYLDSGATTQKPQAVIDRISRFYEQEYASVHRGIYGLTEHATELYEGVREQTRAFLNAADVSEIVFTHGATEGMNMLACGWARHNLKKGDEIVVTELEHHANLLPWQRLEKEFGMVLKFIPMKPDGNLDYAALETVITPKTKVVSVTASSNVIGCAIDIEKIAARAHAVGAFFFVDGAQSVPRMKTDVQKLGCHALSFSGHKMLAPTGVGILYVNKALHETFMPFMVGGSMIMSVDWHESTWRPVPQRLEAGTPAIAQVIGLGAALDYLSKVDFNWLKEHETKLCRTFIDGIQGLKHVRLLGPADLICKEGHLVSFIVDGMHAFDVAAYLDGLKIAVRAGHHCAQPLHNKLGFPYSIRASFYLYNDVDEVERLVKALKELDASLG